MQWTQETPPSWRWCWKRGTQRWPLLEPPRPKHSTPSWKAHQTSLISRLLRPFRQRDPPFWHFDVARLRLRLFRLGVEQFREGESGRRGHHRGGNQLGRADAEADVGRQHRSLVSVTRRLDNIVYSRHASIVTGDCGEASRHDGVQLRLCHLG